MLVTVLCCDAQVRPRRRGRDKPAALVVGNVLVVGGGCFTSTLHKQPHTL